MKGRATGDYRPFAASVGFVTNGDLHHQGHHHHHDGEKEASPAEISPIAAAKKHATEILQFVSSYKWLFEASNISFFANELWHCVPPEWRLPLLSLSQQHLQSFASLQATLALDSLPPLPASLVSFLEGCRSLSLAREPSYVPRGIRAMASGTALSAQFLPFHLQHTFGMRPKKVHEVICMSKVVHEVCRATGIDTVVDVGAGEGYISHVLSQHYGYRVIAIEGNDSYAEKGIQRVKKVSERMKNSTGNGSLAEPHYITFNLKEDTIRQFETRLQETIREIKEEERAKSEMKRGQEKQKQTAEEETEPTKEKEREKDEAEKERGEQKEEKVCVIGLHTCGDLFLQLVDLFCNLPSASALVGVGCCYHKASPAVYEEIIQSFLCTKIFPKSKCLQAQPHRLGWGGLKLATEASFQYSTKDGAAFNHVSYSLFLRACFEVAIRKYYPHTRTDCEDDLSASSDTMHDLAAHQQSMARPRGLMPQKLSPEEKKNQLRHKVKRIRHKSYASARSYVVQSLPRMCVKTLEDGAKWQSINFGPFALFSGSSSSSSSSSSSFGGRRQRERKSCGRCVASF
ncbi:hypothetical protein QOT17_003201 [Balamuthia mandrillaris]